MRTEFPNPTRTAGSGPHIAIPHNYADHEFAYRLAGELRHDRVTRWIDEVDMSGGVFLVSRICQYARPIDFLIPVVSASSVTSNWVQHELRTVMTRVFNGVQIAVITARADNSPLPGFLASQPSFDFFDGGWSRAYDDLMVNLARQTSERHAQHVTSGLGTQRPTRGNNPLLRRKWGS